MTGTLRRRKRSFLWSTPRQPRGLPLRDARERDSLCGFVSLQLAAPVAVVVLHEIGSAIPADVAVPVMLLLRLSQIILGRSLELR